MSECYGEERLAARLGVSRELLRTFRDENLTEGQQWTMAGREVAYSEAGVRMLLTHLGARLREKRPQGPGGLTIQGLLEEARLEDATEAVDEKKAAGPVEDELTVQALTRNGQIVMATRGEELVRVRVRESRHFVPGMRMTCRHLQADLWELVGRCPRFRGRW